MQHLGERIQRLSTAIAAVALLWVLLIVSLNLAPHARAQTYGVDAIGRANVDGSAVEQSFIATSAFSSGMAVDANYVYWTNSLSHSIDRANLDGTGVEQSFLSFAFSAPSGVAVNADHIYWGNNSDYVSPYSIGRANLDGAEANENLIIPGTPHPTSLAVDADHVFWTSGTYDANMIGRAELDGSDVQPHFIDIPSHGSWGLAVNAEHIYWTSFSEGTIGRANLDGSGIDPSFITGLTDPVGIDVDADHIYWTTTRQIAEAPPADWVGTIGRANLDGSGAEPRFITGESHVYDIAVDAAHIYWVNHSDSPYAPCGHCDPPPGDVTPPKTTITKDAPNKTQQSVVTVKFRSDDPFARFECRLDKKTWRACRSPKTFRRLDQGRHRFRVRAVDREGNADLTPAKDKFKVVG